MSSERSHLFHNNTKGSTNIQHLSVPYTLCRKSTKEYVNVLANIASAPVAFSWLKIEFLQQQTSAEHFAGRREHSASQLGASSSW